MTRSATEPTATRRHKTEFEIASLHDYLAAVPRDRALPLSVQLQRDAGAGCKLAIRAAAILAAPSRVELSDAGGCQDTPAQSHTVRIGDQPRRPGSKPRGISPRQRAAGRRQGKRNAVRWAAKPKAPGRGSRIASSGAGGGLRNSA